MGIHVDAQLLKNRHGVFVHFPLVDDAAHGGIAAQPDVVHDGALQSLVQLLVHHGNSVVQGVPAVFEVDLLALQENRAAVLAVNTEETFHQRGFSGTVFAHEGVNRAAVDRERDLVQGLDAREGFCNVCHL